MLGLMRKKTCKTREEMLKVRLGNQEGLIEKIRALRINITEKNTLLDQQALTVKEANEYSGRLRAQILILTINAKGKDTEIQNWKDESRLLRKAAKRSIASYKGQITKLKNKYGETL